MKKTVVIVEDDTRLREQLTSVLQSAPDIECLYSVGSAEEAIERIPLEPADVVLMDLKLPGASGIDCVAALKRTLYHIEIVMLTAYEEEDNIFRALKAGASGYLLKSSGPSEIIEAVRNASSGGVPFSSHIARKVVDFFRKPARIADQENLTKREIEVLELLARGYIYKEIADRLGIGSETVRTYVKRICAKMHVRGRLEAIIKYRW